MTSLSVQVQLICLVSLEAGIVVRVIVVRGIVVRVPDSRLKGRELESSAGVAGEFSSPGSTFRADFYFSICYTLVLLQ